MKRSLTISTFLLAAGLSYGLYHLSYEMQAMEQQLRTLNKALVAEQEEIHVLQAEWSFLTRPKTLQKLAQDHLNLAPIEPYQVAARVTDLPMRNATTLAADRMPLPLPRPAALVGGTRP